jgi:hypothetical protein
MPHRCCLQHHEPSLLLECHGGVATKKRDSSSAVVMSIDGDESTYNIIPI